MYSVNIDLGIECLWLFLRHTKVVNTLLNLKLHSMSSKLTVKNV